MSAATAVRGGPVAAAIAFALVAVTPHGVALAEAGNRSMPHAGASEPEPLSPGELVTALNEQAVVRVDVDVRGYVFDADADEYIYGPGGDPVEVSSAITCTGYVVASTGLIATLGDPCLSPQFGKELIKDRAYEVASENGFNDSEYAPGWEDYDEEDFTDFYRVTIVDDFGNARSNRVDFEPTVTFVNGIDGMEGGEPQRAQIVGRTGVGEGNAGLLRVDANGLPAVEFSQDALESSDPVLVLGYGSYQEALQPDLRSAILGVETTDGVFGAHELDGSVPYLFLGGPVFAEDGRAIGTVDSDRPDVVHPVARVDELLAAAGATNELAPSVQAFHDGVRAYAEGDREGAITELEKVVADQPENAVAADYLDRARSLPEPAVPEDDDREWWPWVALGGGLLILVTVVVATVISVTRRKRAQHHPSPPTFQPPWPGPPGPAQWPRTPAGPPPPPTVPPSPQDPTVRPWPPT